MENSARHRRASRRRGCRRNNRQRGGAGEAYTLGGPVAGAPIINNYGQEIVRYASCEEAVRPGYLTGAQIKGGLPGFAGGGRRLTRMRGGAEGSPYPQTYASETTTYVPPANGASYTPQPVPGATNTRSLNGGSMSGFRGGVLETGADQLAGQMGGRRKKSRRARKGRRGSRKMRGGRYTNEFAPISGATGVLMEPRYSGCGDGALALPDPLNKVQATSLITAPPAQVPLPKPMMGGAGPYAVDAMLYEVPRSGYTTWPSNASGGNAGTLSDGKTPFLLNVPFSAQPTPDGACIKTGGRRKSRKNRKSRKSARKSKKSRRNNRR
jgi:hypothetical protein